jgi:NAD(P)-dependent dehydrogenase (short-subunit alcohol dehydrogenase family)
VDEVTAGIDRIDGTVAIVTGGASGIGLGIARCLAGEGATVVIADVERAALRTASAELGAMGVETDVRDPAGVHRLADAVLERHGHVDIVVNNAGIGPFAAVAHLQPADWRWIINVNLWGVINGISTFLPLLRANPNGGHIVNTASMAGLTPRPGHGGELRHQVRRRRPERDARHGTRG